MFSDSLYNLKWFNLGQWMFIIAGIIFIAIMVYYIKKHKKIKLIASIILLVLSISSIVAMNIFKVDYYPNWVEPLYIGDGTYCYLINDTLYKCKGNKMCFYSYNSTCRTYIEELENIIVEFDIESHYHTNANIYSLSTTPVHYKFNLSIYHISMDTGVESVPFGEKEIEDIKTIMIDYIKKICSNKKNNGYRWVQHGHSDYIQYGSIYFKFNYILKERYA